MNNDQILKLKMLIWISCRCILKTYKEWIFIRKINVPFKDNKNVNERWDIRNHPFHKQVSTVTYIQKITWHLKVIKYIKVNKKYILNCYNV